MVFAITPAWAQGHGANAGGQGSGQAGKGPVLDAGAGAKGGAGASERGHGPDAIVQGKRGSSKVLTEGEEEDSDRPAWAGISGSDGKPGRPNTEPGTMKGDLYGDLYVILRNPDGTPVLDENGNVILIGSDGSRIYLTEEGDIPEDKLALVQEVEFSRLNVGRSPERVLDTRLEEAIANLNASTTPITVDASGRLVYTVDGETKTIDSPLENLALYVELMNTGTIDGLTVAVSPDLAFMTDDKLTTADLDLAASLYAAAADKTGTVTVDQVVYFNTILGVTGTDPITVSGDQYFDYTDFDYDRSDMWDGVTTTVLVYDAATDSWKSTEVDIYDSVFNSTDTSATSVAGFTQAADDALQVIEYIHEYAVPVLPTLN